MELRQMKYFLAVLEHGGITRAAQALYISQPSLSQAIRTLESQYGTALFERAGRELKPTPAALSLADSIRDVLSLVEVAQSRVRDVVSLNAGRLNIAAAATLALHPLPGLVKEFLDQFPLVGVHINDVGTSSQALDLVRSGHVDFALLELPVDVTGIVTDSLGWEELFIVGRVPELEVYSSEVPASALADIPTGIISREESGYTPAFAAMTSLLQNIRAITPDRQFLWELVQAGAVATFIPEQVAKISLPNMPLYRVKPSIKREVGLAYRDSTISPAASAFLSILSTSPLTKETKPLTTPDVSSSS